MGRLVQANYQELESVGMRFGQQAHAIHEMRRNTQRAEDNLKPGWIGYGSDAFFAEFEHKILPALVRLEEALTEARQKTQQIAQLFSAAEHRGSSSGPTCPRSPDRRPRTRSLHRRRGRRSARARRDGR